MARDQVRPVELTLLRGSTVLANILILQEYIPRYRRRFFERLGLELEAIGHRLLIGIGDPSESLKARGDSSHLPQYELNMRELTLSIFGRRVVMRATGAAIRHADYVIAEHARRNLDVYRLLLPKRWRKVPFALWGHGRDYVKRSSQIERRLLSVLAKRADWYFVYTDGGREHLINDLGLDPTRITVVQNSTDTGELQEQLEHITADDIAKFRETVGAQGPVVLYVGALDPSKRIDLLLAGAEEAHRSISDMKLVVVGDGVLRHEVQASALSRPWMSCTGPLFGRDKAVALAAADVLANPGRVGLIAVDSFAANVPIVTVDHDFHAPEFEYLANGQNCLISENSTHSFAESLIRFLTDTTLRSHLQKGCAQSNWQYSVDGMVTNYLNGVTQWTQHPRGG